jgi:hypothetical protein
VSRPSTFTQETADAICARIAEGEPLRQICRDEAMPAWRTVYGWMDAHEDFAAHIAHAREHGGEAIAQDCLAIADNGEEDVQRSKLRIETRLKLLAKWNPKRYGERSTLDLANKDGVPFVINFLAADAKL